MADINDRVLQLARMIAINVSTLERRLELARKAGQQFGSDREMWKQLGYPDTLHIQFEEFLGKYMREDVAGAIVDAPAQTTWRVEPMVMEVDAEGELVEDSEFATGVASALDAVDAVHKFERLDRLAGIGRYAVALVGTRGGKDLTKPVTEDGLNGPEDILFVSVYHEKDAPVIQLNEDAADPRFGLPEMYRVQLIKAEIGGGGKKAKQKVELSEEVHHSRLIHVADDLLDDDVFGRPRLERVFNRLEDLLKITGGSAEMFWSNVGGLLHGDVSPEFDLGREEDDKSAAAVLEDIADRLTELQLKGVRRAFATQGMELQFVGAGTPDPRGIFEVLKEVIAAAARIPQRILFGSERGELASTQDEREWLSRMGERQQRFAGPMIVGGFVDLMLAAGAVTLSEGHSYRVLWPDLFRLTDLERAEMAANIALAAQRLTPVGGDPRESVELALALAEGDVDADRLVDLGVRVQVAEEATAMLQRERELALKEA